MSEKDICNKCGKEYDLRSEAGAGTCDSCRFGDKGVKLTEPLIVPYTGDEIRTARAYVREKDLRNGGHIHLARFTEPREDGECGISLIYLSPVKDGRRTELRFSLSDEAAMQTCLMLQEFFGVGMCA